MMTIQVLILGAGCALLATNRAATYRPPFRSLLLHLCLNRYSSVTLLKTASDIGHIRLHS